MALWQIWWVWMAGGVLVAALEILLPGYVFLGFAAGGVLTGVLLGVGVLDQSAFSTILMVFAFLSLIGWGIMRLVLGTRPGQVKIWDRDINDNTPRE